MGPRVELPGLMPAPPQRIKEGSVIDHIQLISVGDMIEAINGQSLLGCRHYEVARLLKELPRGRTFTLKLTEPRKAFGEPSFAPWTTHRDDLELFRNTDCSPGNHQQVAPKPAMQNGDSPTLP